MNLYRYDDYKLVLAAKIKEFKGHRGIVTKMAEAAGCQRSYLSQVLNSHIHLTPDQALGLTSFLNFNEEETNFFLILVDYSRAGSRALKQRLKQQLEVIKKRNADLENRIPARVIQTSESTYQYYSSWIWSAIHIIVSIPEFQTVEAISAQLQIPKGLVEEALFGLAEMGLVQKSGNHWKYVTGEQHLSKRSALVALHHSNWRQRATLSAQIQNEESYHYTGISSVSHYDYQVIQDMLLKITEEIRKIISLSKEEKLICLNLDLFKS